MSRGDMQTTLIVPCYNEARRWNVDYWDELVAQVPARWIFVDDGSSDDTLDLAHRALAGGIGEAFRLPTNSGKAEAVRQGMLRAAKPSPAEGNLIGFIDADGAFAAADVNKIIGIAQAISDSFDAVWAARVALAGRSIQRTARRHYLGRAVATYVSWGAPAIPYDTQAGFKVFAATDDLAQCIQEPFATRWLFELELLNRWNEVVGRYPRIWEEPLDEWTEIPGSSISLREVARISRELIVLKRLQRRQPRNPGAKGSTDPQVQLP